MSFWASDVGKLTGTAEDAFTPTFSTIPDDTMAIAKIEKFELQTHNGEQHYQIEWVLTDGEFKGRHVFHKIHAFDKDSNRRHRFLNMMMLIYNMFHVKPKDSNPPQNQDLRVFIGKHAGIRIQEWEKDGKSGNYVSEVHPADGFKSVTGKKMQATSTHSHSEDKLESAFDRYNKQKAQQPADDLSDDIPF